MRGSPLVCRIMPSVAMSVVGMFQLNMLLEHVVLYAAPHSSSQFCDTAPLRACAAPSKRAVGGAAGFVGGYALKASQNFVLNAALCGGGALAAACVAGWLSPEELVEKAEGLVEKADSYMEVGLKMLLGESGPDAKKSAASRVSKISLSKMYRTAPGLI